MPKPTDDEPVKIRYSSALNISFHGTANLGMTWGEWRELDGNEQGEALAEAVHKLVDIDVIGED